jgi:hypothetical protein
LAHSLFAHGLFAHGLFAHGLFAPSAPDNARGPSRFLGKGL